MKYKPFNTTIDFYGEAILLKPVNDRVNAINVVNVGDAPAFINGRVLYPGTPGTVNGDSYSLGGNADEVFMGQIQISFGAGANPRVLVEQKFFT